MARESDESMRVLAETLDRMQLTSVPAARLLLKCIRYYLVEPTPGDLDFCLEVFRRLDRGLKRKIAAAAVSEASHFNRPATGSP
ncbi:MAG: hypothetical protein P4M00_14950 [Azospirillaceae bacterium]|nr:hypothetical protein [Azospirillaceae bacterium]